MKICPDRERVAKEIAGATVGALASLSVQLACLRERRVGQQSDEGIYSPVKSVDPG